MKFEHYRSEEFQGIRTILHQIMEVCYNWMLRAENVTIYGRYDRPIAKQQTDERYFFHFHTRFRRMNPTV